MSATFLIIFLSQLRLANLIILSQKCEELGVALLDVPCDGDCMAWSLRGCLLGAPHVIANGYKTQKGKSDMKRIREMMGHAWESVVHDPSWQLLFDCFCADLLPPDEPPQTPEKKARRKPHPERDPQGLEPDLATPEKFVEKEKGRKASNSKTFSTVLDAKPVPLAQKQNPCSPGFKHPQKKRRRHSALEPEMDDIEEVFDADMRALPDVNEANVEDIGCELLGAPEIGSSRKRKCHQRQAKSLTKTDQQRRMGRLEVFLASRGMDYAAWSYVHKQDCIIKKAATCEGGGFVTFKNALCRSTKITCASCLRLFDSLGVTMESLLEDLDRPQKDAEKGNKDSSPKAAKKTRRKKQTPEEIMQAQEECVKYVKSKAPIVDFVEKGGEWYYRCKVCRTKTQPEGKLNKLAVKELNSVKSFLDQHLDCPSHLAKLAKLNSETASPTSIPCPGLCISKDTPGNLGQYVTEFALWASHTKLDLASSKVNAEHASNHSYWRDMNSDSWWVRSKHCEGNYLSSKRVECCPRCVELTVPKRIQRQVVRFASKYYSARLLHKKLFAPETELEELIAEIDLTTFARNNHVHWGKVKRLKNRELQTYVRKSFASTAKYERTALLSHFFASVVEPCLKVHASAMTSNLTVLSAQFLEALTANEQSVPWSEIDCLIYLDLIFSIFLIYSQNFSNN